MNRLVHSLGNWTVDMQGFARELRLKAIDQQCRRQLMRFAIGRWVIDFYEEQEDPTWARDPLYLLYRLVDVLNMIQ